MRYRPVKKPAPMPENPYHRIFTPMPSFEDLVRKAREEEKKLKVIKNKENEGVPAARIEISGCGHA